MRFLTLITGVFIGLSGCTLFEEPTKPKPRPSGIKPAPKPPVASIESQQAAAYYASIQARLRSQGLLRQETNPSDARFTISNLVENFERVALFDEYSIRNNTFVEGQTASTLRRWERPITIGVSFGPSVTEKQRAMDTASVRQFAKRLASLTGLNISLADARRANFSILFLNKDEQRDLTPKLANRIKYLTPQIVDEIQNSPRSIFCVAYAVSEAGSNEGYKGAVILIKAEHTDLMRKSCIQEEMAQALGLANDSPKARPSIFNDDEEFALMTQHDELLLEMLYDPRLSIGMTVQDAHPIVQQIAQELLATGRS
ncbi:DUF2927 domain-containing protein [Amylibacter sp. SFDW26]|uniref:DUF2927 domain-containing protein n=1 Tax=Amylibacter sp. SFDW26 TaxID=2652722 RepID=UPI001262268E|nr:DUF2927 domain-containing protein [Amylibacter sp. SFDW26]KAB7610359.1 DUF2927 domain-containing protein [Amylibacter sp. SFDW26]